MCARMCARVLSINMVIPFGSQCAVRLRVNGAVAHVQGKCWRGASCILGFVAAQGPELMN